MALYIDFANKDVEDDGDFSENLTRASVARIGNQEFLRYLETNLYETSRLHDILTTEFKMIRYFNDELTDRELVCQLKDENYSDDFITEFLEYHKIPIDSVNGDGLLAR